MLILPPSTRVARRWRAGAVAALSLLVVTILGSSGRAGRSGPRTLRQLYGLAPPARIAPASSALVLVDFQEEFFSGGLPVEGGAAAVERAASLLAWARAHDLLVVHVRQVAARPGSLLFDADSPTIAPVPALAPTGHELVVTKSAAGAFTGTDLAAVLHTRGIDTLIVAGIMTHLAVDTTVRDAALQGFRVLVAHDACATRALPSPVGGGVIAARDVHRASLAALADRFADVRSAAELAAIPLADR